MKTIPFEKSRLTAEQLDTMRAGAVRETPTHLFVRDGCQHWRASGAPSVGTCAIEARPGTIHVSACHSCTSRKPPEPVALTVDSRPVSASALARNAAHAAASVIRTAAGIDRATSDEVAARLAVCATCEHAVRDAAGKVSTCGPMLSAAKEKGAGTCGCVLSAKARDRREACPLGKWTAIVGV